MLSARPPPQIRQLFAALLEQTQLSKASDRELLRKLFRLQVKERVGGVEKTSHFWSVTFKVTGETVFNDNEAGQIDSIKILSIKAREVSLGEMAIAVPYLSPTSVRRSILT